MVLAVPIPNVNLADAETEANSFNEVPLTALSPQTRRQLSNLLNSKKYLLSEFGYYRDWRGIAVLTHQKDFFDESAISGSDPTSKVLDQWFKFYPDEANFAKLQQILGVIDRWDASDDIYENLVEDAKNFKTQQKKKSTRPTVVASSTCESTMNENLYDILTIDDARLAAQNLPPQIYDAFVLFADADAEYAAEIKKRLEEDSKYNLKLCFKDDVLSGTSFLHTTLSQLIEERCNRVIAIYTREFRKTPENEFLVSYAHAVQIAKRKDLKILPIVYDDVELPPTLRFYTHLRHDSYNFWDRLAASIRTISFVKENSTTPSINDKVSSSSNNQQTEIPNLPTPPTEIPSINITPAQDENDAPTVSNVIKEKRAYKKNTANGYSHGYTTANHNNNLHQNNPNHNNNLGDNLSSKFMHVKGLVLRHAHSTSQLNGKSYKETNASSSDVSVSSNCSETHKKKKKKWSTKFFKRVFTRSNSKLQTAV